MGLGSVFRLFVGLRTRAHFRAIATLHLIDDLLERRRVLARVYRGVGHSCAVYVCVCVCVCVCVRARARVCVCRVGVLFRALYANQLCMQTNSTPTLTHRTQRVTEEFYRQGDDEKKANIRVSPFMDRLQVLGLALASAFHLQPN